MGTGSAQRPTRLENPTLRIRLYTRDAQEVALLESLSGPRLRPGPGSRSTPGGGEGVVTTLKSRLARAAWVLASLAALAATVGAANKW
jgi:hypothetical protein